MTFFYFVAAGFCEITGCFSLLIWLRLGRSVLLGRARASLAWRYSLFC